MTTVYMYAQARLAMYSDLRVSNLRMSGGSENVVHPFGDKSDIFFLLRHESDKYSFFFYTEYPLFFQMEGGSAGAGFAAHVTHTGKRSREDEAAFAKRARTGHFEAGTHFELAAGGEEDQAMEMGVQTADRQQQGFWYAGDGCEAAHPQALPSVYEQYLIKEQHLMAEAAQRAQQHGSGAGAFRCPSEWSGTERDCCPSMPFVQVHCSIQSGAFEMECDGTNDFHDRSLYNASLYGEIPPRGC